MDPYQLPTKKRHHEQQTFNQVLAQTAGDGKYLHVSKKRKSRVITKWKSTPTLVPGLYPQKSLLYVWGYITCIVHCHLLERGRTLTDIYYQHPDRVNEGLLLRCSALINGKAVISQYDMTRTYTTKQIPPKIRSIG